MQLQQREDGQSVTNGQTATGQSRDYVFATNDQVDKYHVFHYLQNPEAEMIAFWNKMVDSFYILEAVRDEQQQILDFICCFANRAACHNNQQTLNDIVGKTPTQIWAGLDAKYLQIARQVTESGDMCFFERVEYVDERQPYLTGVYELQVSKLGDGIAVTLRNITDKVHREEQTFNRKCCYKRIVESYSDIIARFDQQLCCLYVSEELTREFGQPVADALGQHWTELGWNPENYEVVQQKLEQVFASKLADSFEVELCAQYVGQPYTYWMRVIPELDGRGEVESVLTITHNITDKKRVEAEMARLDRLNLLGEMAAGLGHEVRNPMTTVRGYLQMFKVKDQFSRYSTQLDTMIMELDRANSIISEYLSLAKSKAIMMRIGSLNAVVAALLPLLQADAFRAGHELVLDIADVCDVTLDDKEIRQLLLNLVRNGLEAMETPGRLTVMTYMQGAQVVLAVKDEGKGIPEQIINRLGVPFMTTKENGTGLGLSVCYRIAERHNAVLTFSTSEQGTIFHVTFNAVQ